MPTRHDGRAPHQLREVRITRSWLDHAEGSVLVEFGATRVLVAASVTEGVPRWRKGSGLGWVTSEYAMLPRSTHTRSDRESVRGKIGGRTHEISRLIGRSLRAVIDYKALGENTIVLDCDVLQADGGTRTASITGAYVALVDAVNWLRERGALAGEPLLDSVAAVSVGVVDGTPSSTSTTRRTAPPRLISTSSRPVPGSSSRCRAPPRASPSTATSSISCSTSGWPAAPISPECNERRWRHDHRHDRPTEFSSSAALPERLVGDPA